MSQTSSIVFTALKIVSWLIFVGLGIEAGGLIVNFIFSIWKPEVLGNLYQKLEYSFILFISILKAVLFYLVVRLVSNIDLAKPFSSAVSRQITQISYYTLSVGLISYIGRQTAKSLQHHDFITDSLDQFWADSQAFVLMAAVIYIIATIFKKGIEIQTENDLTV
ncbi:MAG: DUF2975 domain-containing protein [Sphingobacteriales bacterium]|nr:MAG: DUF2975 domain-containing protein [Sphingobacteriales bacterium]